MIKVLLVDDHEIVRRGLKDLLLEEFPDGEFGEAGTVPEGREALAQQHWDLVVLDISLPGTIGLDLLTDLKRVGAGTVTLVLSSYPEEEFAIRALKLGAAGYLTKASIADEMLLAVRKVLAGGKYVSASLAENLAASLGDQSGEPHDSLSIRELEVLKAVALGKTIKAIAADLSLSEKTIGTYRTRISRKLGLSTNVEIARYALRYGLVE